jgi:membrane protein DedA with SNARE-associated domain
LRQLASGRSILARIPGPHPWPASRAGDQLAAARFLGGPGLAAKTSKIPDLPCWAALIFYTFVKIDLRVLEGTGHVQHLISQYGYLAVFVLMLAESACVPVPSEVIMMFGGALAGGAVAGAHPSLTGVFAAGVLGNVAGSYLSWAVGKHAGQAAIRRWGRRVGIREHEIDKATAWFERHGPVAVLVGRVVPVIRTFISLPAGFAEMPAGRFGLYTALGAIPWTAALAIAGYALGANWEHVANDFHGPTYVIAGLLVVGIIVVIVRRRRKSAGSAAPAQESWAPPSADRDQVARGPAGAQPWRPASAEPAGYAPAPAGYQPGRASDDRWQ